MRYPIGLDALRDSGFAAVRGKRVGLVTHPAAVDANLTSAAEVFADTDACKLVRLFGPEHGFAGNAQDLEGVAETERPHPRFGVPVVSLYGDTAESLKPTPKQLADLDALVIDMVDVGSRYYTFQATMLFCLEAAAEVGLPVVVLDRDNPIGLTEVEGPTVRPGFESFVGVHPIATRHGLTMGELAALYKAERVPGADLTVIPVPGLDRNPNVFRLPGEWLSPSPNMPHPTTAEVYPGLCLIEGTNLSEGRGTCRPFELVGHPKLDPWKAADALNAEGIPGVRFLPASFTPKFQKHANHLCGGVQLVVTDYDDFKAVRTGLAVIQVLRRLLGDEFRWRTETYEFVSHLPAIDLLFGSDRERLALEAGVPWREIAAAWEPEEAEFRRRREPHLLYRSPQPDGETGSRKGEASAERASADDRPGEVAARALEERLDRVRRLFRRVANQAVTEPVPGADIELVHQFRVGTRRAAAALDLFAPLVPRRRSDWFRRRFRRLRRAANDVRDADVLAERLRSMLPSPAVERWLEVLAAERRDARDALAALTGRAGFRRRLRRRARALLERVRARAVSRRADTTEFREWVSERLRSIAADFFAAVPADTSDTAALHRFRVLGKRLRYALELAADAFPGEQLDRLRRRLAEVQDALGEVNDLAVARGRAQQRSARLEPGSDPAAWQALIADLGTRFRQAVESYSGRFPPSAFREIRTEVAALLDPPAGAE